MALTRTQLRSQVGRELGIIFSGTATSVDAAGAVQLNDTSDDSPFDPGDDSSRFNGAGLYILDSDADRYFRQNLTYVPASQRVTWTGALSPALTDTTPDYEIHTEPILSPFTIWPTLIDDALRLIRFISFQYISLTGRNYYDLADWDDIIGVERFRRLYYVGQNLLKNSEFRWPAAATVPTDWVMTLGTAGRNTDRDNVAYAVELDTTESIRQDATIRGPQRVRGVISVTNTGGTQTLSLTARRADGSSDEITSVASDGTTAVQQIVADLETTDNTATVRFEVNHVGGGSIGIVWSPMLYNLTDGVRQRIRPANVIQADATTTDPNIRLYCPDIDDAVGEMALLLPYPALALDTSTTAAPDDLIRAAVAVQVLRWLVSSPQIVDKSEYQQALTIWADKFDRRSKEHMRKIQKSRALWESGELAFSHMRLRRNIVESH